MVRFLKINPLNLRGLRTNKYNSFYKVKHNKFFYVKIGELVILLIFTKIGLSSMKQMNPHTRLARLDPLIENVFFIIQRSMEITKYHNFKDCFAKFVAFDLFAFFQGGIETGNDIEEEKEQNKDYYYYRCGEIDD